MAWDISINGDAIEETFTGNVTLSFARAMLAIWLKAEAALATGEMYRMGSRQLQRVNLPAVSERVAFWRNEVARLSSGRSRGARVMRVIPRDL